MPSTSKSASVLAERRHPRLAVAGVGRADALPAVGRRARLAVRADRRGVGVVLEVGRVVHRVELGEDLRPLPLEQRDGLAGEPAGADPDGVDAVVGQRLAPVEDLLRHAAVDARTSTGRPSPASSAPPSFIRHSPTAATATMHHGPDILALGPPSRPPRSSRPSQPASIARAIRASEPGATQHQSSRFESPSSKCCPSGYTRPGLAVAQRHDERVGAGRWASSWYSTYDSPGRSRAGPSEVQHGHVDRVPGVGPRPPGQAQRGQARPNGFGSVSSRS
jgi:hypothetical protein